MIKTPVIIPAFNEEYAIARTLYALPSELTEPIVAVNGSTDRTAAVAEGFGARVINLPEQGKLPAIQETMRAIGSRALEPLIILDADTRPSFPYLWHKNMLRHLTDEESKLSIAVCGPTWFIEGNIAGNAIRSVRRLRRAQKASKASARGGQYGPNMGLYLKDSDALEEILELPHFWPGEDKAIVDTVLSHGGSYEQPIDLRLMTLTRLPEAYSSFAERRRLGIQEARKKIDQSYKAKAALGSKRYSDLTF